MYTMPAYSTRSLPVAPRERDTNTEPAVASRNSIKLNTFPTGGSDGTVKAKLSIKLLDSCSSATKFPEAIVMGGTQYIESHDPRQSRNRFVGAAVLGLAVGLPGVTEGDAVGTAEGRSVGTCVGPAVGAWVGNAVGKVLGDIEGKAVGATVGLNVG